MIKKTFLALFISAFFLACSSDESHPEDKITSVTATVNGVPMVFQPTGRGIDLTQDGYKLSLWFSRYVSDPYEQEDIYLEMRYRKKGNNVIEQFQYNQYVNGQSFEGDFVNAGFQDNVSVNSKSRFKATASGSLTIGGQIVTITDFKVNYVYEEPF